MTAQQGTTHSGSRTWGECGRDHGLSLSTPDLLEFLRCKIAGAPGELLRPQHIDYCLGWAAAVNPEGAPITTMYCGIGADLCTVLLSTNPAHIIGVDQQPVELSKFKRLIQLWEALDCDPCQIKSVAPIPGLGCEDIDKLLLEVDLGYRRIHGFWDMDSLRKYGLEWCALIELRKLGVQMKSIEVLASREGPLLSFEYGHPSDQEAKRRTVQFVNLNHLEAMEYFAIFNSGREGISCLYEKSVPRVGRNDDLERIDKVVSPGGSVLLGDAPEAGLTARGELHQGLLDRGYSRISIAAALEQQAESAFEYVSAGDGTPTTPHYGWRMHGFRKRR